MQHISYKHMLNKFEPKILLYLTTLAANVARPVLVGFELFPDDGKVWLVGGQAQHDEVSISPAEHMLRVRVVVRRSALATDVVHDLVLPFTGTIGIREDHLDHSEQSISKGGAQYENSLIQAIICFKKIRNIQ